MDVFNTLIKNIRTNSREQWERLISVAAQNEEELRLGRLFIVLMVISIGIVISLALIFLLMRPLGFITSNVNLIAACFPTAFIPLSIFCLQYAKKGHIRKAITLYVWVNFTAIGVAAWLFDGIYSPAWVLYIWTITIAGTLLAPRYALWMTIGVVTYFFLLLVLQSISFYEPLLSFGVLGREFATQLFLLVMLISTVGILTYLNMCSLRNIMKNLHQEIAERRHAQTALHESEEKYRSIADFTYDWEYWITPDGHYIYVSPSSERITGYRPEEFIEDPNLVTSIVHQDDRAKVIHHMRNIHQDSVETHSLYFRIITRNGQERWINHTCVAVSSSEGKYLGRRGSNRDVTEQMRIDAALRESEIKYRKIFENVQDIFFQTDLAGTIIEISPSIERYSGFPRDVLIGSPVSNVYVHPEDNVKLFRMLAQTGEVVDYEVQLKSKEDRTIFTSVNAHLMYDAEGTSIGIEGSLRDVTERKRIEKEREKLIEELQENLAKVKTLSGLLPICASCKKIRDDKGYWNQVENYLIEHTEAQLTHGICPDCMKKLYSDYRKK